jgi:hemolysin activation/secretion protein
MRLLTLATLTVLINGIMSRDASSAAPQTPTQPQKASVPEMSGSPQPATVAAPEAHFDIHEYRVLGNTTLATRDIERLLYPLLGDHKSIADVEVARTALEKAYHDRGFATVFIDIPEQDVADAVVRL